MKRTLLLLWVLVVNPGILFSQQITFSILEAPQPNSIWVDTIVPIQVAVYAPATITAVTATIATSQAALIYDASTGQYTGSVSLSGIAGDTLTLRIAAADTLGHRGDTTRTFIYRPLNDPGITFTIDSLAEYAVARPVLKLNAKCSSDAGECTIRAVALGLDPVELAVAKDSLPQIDLFRFNGNRVHLAITVTDAAGRRRQKELYAFVETSPYLTEHFTAGRIMDFRDNKAVVADVPSGYPYIVDIATGQRTPILISKAVVEQQAFITPYGALFLVDNIDRKSLYEWKNGRLTLLEDTADYLVTAGDYAAWVRENSIYSELMRKNLATGATGAIHSVQRWKSRVKEPSVAENGTIAFTVETDLRGGIHKYKDGQVITVSDNENISYHLPLTDGKRVMYSQVASGGVNTSVYLDNANNQPDILLSANTLPGAFRRTNYLLNSNYAAFTRPDGAGKQQVFIRDTIGNTRQVTSLSQDHEVEALNLTGEMMVIGGYRRHFVNQNGQSGNIAASIAYNRMDGYLISTSYYDSTS